jgi:hypothetical protein
MFVNGLTVLRKERVLVVSSSTNNPAGLAKQRPMNKIPPITCWGLVAASPIVSYIAGGIALAGGGHLGSRGGVQRGLHCFSTKHPRDNDFAYAATACTCLSAGSVGLGSGDS